MEVGKLVRDLVHGRRVALLTLLAAAVALTCIVSPARAFVFRYSTNATYTTARDTQQVYGTPWVQDRSGYTIIPVCVVGGSTADQSYEGQNHARPLKEVEARIREALAESWESSSGVRFTGFHGCGGLQPSERDHTLGLCILPDADSKGGPGVGATSGVCEEDDENPSNSISQANVNVHPWGNNPYKDRCIYFDSGARMRYSFECVEHYADHEFGHALGLMHEWYAPATPDIGTDNCVADNHDKGDYRVFGLYQSSLRPFPTATQNSPDHYFVPDPAAFDNFSTMSYDDTWESKDGPCAYHYYAENSNYTDPLSAADPPIRDPSTDFKIPFGSLQTDRFGKVGDGGPSGLSDGDRAGIAKVYPRPAPGPYDVGVLRVKGDDDCGHGEAEPLTIDLDTENDSDHPDTAQGWTGASGLGWYSDSDLALEFCRVDGRLFHVPVRGKYAVLKLGQGCPPDATGAFVRYFDTENDDNIDFHSGDIGLNSSFPNKSQALLTFCVYDADATTSAPRGSFPALPFGYGVFQEGDELGGGIVIHDEKDDNQDSLDSMPLVPAPTAPEDRILAAGSSQTFFALHEIQTGPAPVVSLTASAGGASVGKVLVGQQVALRAAVQAPASSPSSDGNPTGYVEFTDGDHAITGCDHVDVVASGGNAATCTTHFDDVADSPHQIRARFYGTGIWINNANETLSLDVGQAAPTVSVVASPSPGHVEQDITYTASVSGPAGAAAPTGTVTFTDGGNPVCPDVALGDDGATCTLGYAAGSAGVRKIQAIYNGDTRYTGAVGSVDETILHPTTTTLTSTANPSVSGQAVTYTAHVGDDATDGSPTGSLTFTDGGKAISGCGPKDISADSSTVTCSVTYAGPSGSPHAIKAAYSGDDSFDASSAALDQAVGKADTSTTLESTDGSSVSGEEVTFTANVKPTSPGSGTPTGSVTFSGVGGCSDRALSDKGVATCTATFEATSGSQHAITATYGGDDAFSGSDAKLTQTVDKADTSTTLESSDKSSVSGQQVKFTATVKPTAPGSGMPTGTVAFKGVDGCGAQLLSSGGVATCTTAFAQPDDSPYTVTAVYSGDGDFGESTSKGLSQTVDKADTTLKVTTSEDPVAFGKPVTLKADVTVDAPGAGVPSSTVQFSANGVSMGEPVALDGGEATLDVPMVLPGTTFEAAYSGESRFNQSSGTVSPEVRFDHTVSGETGQVSAQSGSWLIDGATVRGAILIGGGADVVVRNSSASRLSASRGGALAICGSTIATLGSVDRATGPVLVGDPTGPTHCAGNAFGLLLTLSSNHAGATVADNHVGLSLTIDGTTGGQGTLVAANQVGLLLNCASDDPPPIDGGRPNSARMAMGQCRSLTG